MSLIVLALNINKCLVLSYALKKHPYCINNNYFIHKLDIIEDLGDNFDTKLRPNQTSSKITPTTSSITLMPLKLFIYHW